MHFSVFLFICVHIYRLIRNYINLYYKFLKNAIGSNYITFIETNKEKIYISESRNILNLLYFILFHTNYVHKIKNCQKSIHNAFDNDKLRLS